MEDIPAAADTAMAAADTGDRAQKIEFGKSKAGNAKEDCNKKRHPHDGMDVFFMCIQF